MRIFEKINVSKIKQSHLLLFSFIGVYFLLFARIDLEAEPCGSPAVDARVPPGSAPFYPLRSGDCSVNVLTDQQARAGGGNGGARIDGGL
jgi:hypothetical protein